MVCNKTAKQNGQGILAFVALLLLVCCCCTAEGGGTSGHYRGTTSNYSYESTSSNNNNDGDGEDTLFAILFFFFFLPYWYFKDQIWAAKLKGAEECIIEDVLHGDGTRGGSSSRFGIAKANFTATYTYTQSSSWMAQPQRQQHQHQHQHQRTDNRSMGELSFSRNHQQQTGARTSSSNESTSLLMHQAARKCLKISGSGSDIDGNFQITKGLMSPISGKCFWVKESEDGNKQTLIMGTISWNSDHNENASFRGQWVAQDGTTGFFSSFDLVPVVGTTMRAPPAPSVVAAIALPAPMAVAVAMPSHDDDGEDNHSFAAAVQLEDPDTLLASATNSGQECKATIPV